MIQRIHIILLSILLPGAVFGFDITLTAKPGRVINGADLGLKMGNLNWFCGTDLFRISAENSLQYGDNGTRYSDGRYLYSWRGVNVEGHAWVLVPHIGVKYSPTVLAFHKDLNTYLKGAYFFSIRSADVSAERVWVYEEQFGVELGRFNDPADDISDAEKNTATDLLSFKGYEFGVGSEYKFSSWFSLGAEFGIRHIRYNAVYDEHQTYFGKASWGGKLRSAYRFTYSALTVNFAL